MLFKDIKQTYPVFILDKQSITITQGTVTSVGFPRLDFNQGKPNNISSTVIDVTIEANGKTATYTIPDNLSVTYTNNLVLSTSKDGLVREVESMKASAEQILSSIDKQREIVSKATELLSDINPIFKEKKETEQRFSKIENSINDMKNIVTNFINSFNNGQSNTGQTS